jgi:hypothetical protein
MNSSIIRKAQQYLTINDGFSEKKLFDIAPLAITHGMDEVIMHLCELYTEKHNQVAALMSRNDTSIMLDMTIGAMFRLTHAISLLNKNITEDAYDSQCRTNPGRTACSRNSKRDSGARFRKNRHNAA